jgi:hypothetical protein
MVVLHAPKRREMAPGRNERFFDKEFQLTGIGLRGGGDAP